MFVRWLVRSFITTHLHAKRYTLTKFEKSRAVNTNERYKTMFCIECAKRKIRHSFYRYPTTDSQCSMFIVCMSGLFLFYYLYTVLLKSLKPNLSRESSTKPMKIILYTFSAYCNLILNNFQLCSGIFFSLSVCTWACVSSYLVTW